MFYNNPYISILKLKGSVVDVSVVAITCAILETWDYRAALVAISGLWLKTAAILQRIKFKSHTGKHHLP